MRCIIFILFLRVSGGCFRILFGEMIENIYSAMVAVARARFSFVECVCFENKLYVVCVQMRVARGSYTIALVRAFKSNMQSEKSKLCRMYCGGGAFTTKQNNMIKGISQSY